MKKKVLVTREVFDETIDFLAGHFDVTSNQANVDYSRDQMVARLQGMDGALVTTTDRVDEDLLSRCPSLKAVCSVSVGFNHIDLEACTRHGVIATNTPGVLTDSVADMAVCLTLATVRRAMEGERMVRARQWQGTQLKQLLGHDLHHAKVGICGLGRIGQTIARRLRGFEVELLYTDLVRADPKVEEALGAKFLAKEELLRQADIVILILPYTPQTHYYIGAAELAQMRRSAVLINIARGSIVDDTALAQALKARTDLGRGTGRLRERAEGQPGAVRAGQRGADPAHRERDRAHTSGDGHAGGAQLRDRADQRRSATEPVEPRGSTQDLTTSRQPTSHRGHNNREESDRASGR